MWERWSRDAAWNASFHRLTSHSQACRSVLVTLYGTSRHLLFSSLSSFFQISVSIWTWFGWILKKSLIWRLFPFDVSTSPHCLLTIYFRLFSVFWRFYTFNCFSRKSEISFLYKFWAFFGLNSMWIARFVFWAPKYVRLGYVCHHHHTIAVYILCWMACVYFCQTFFFLIGPQSFKTC